jgi:hypothetical protein
VESQGNESPVADLSRMRITMFNDVKDKLENTEKQVNKPQENMDKKTQEDTETAKRTQIGFQQTMK